MRIITLYFSHIKEMISGITTCHKGITRDVYLTNGPYVISNNVVYSNNSLYTANTIKFLVENSVHYRILSIVGEI
jgi:hypothetical protein